MKFFVDESGSFAISPYRYEHRVGVVSVISVVDDALPILLERYREFLKGLRSCELENGEPKGAILTPASQRAFCAMLSGTHGIIVTPSIFDLSMAFDHELDRFPVKMSGILRNHAKDWPETGAKLEMEILARQFSNLSVEQAIRLWAWSSAIYSGLYFAILFQSRGQEGDSWRKVNLQIDQVRCHPTGRENLVFENIWKMWWGAWSRADPIQIVDEWYPVDHPIRVLYDTGPGIDVQAMLGKAMEWVDSRGNPGIQIADISSSIVSRAALRLEKDEVALEIFGRLMASSCHGPNSDRLLVSPGEVTSGYASKKFQCLSRAMRGYGGDEMSTMSE